MAEHKMNQQAGRLDHLQGFYDLGMRMLTLTWDFENKIGCPNAVYWNEERRILASQQ